MALDNLKDIYDIVKEAEPNAFKDETSFRQFASDKNNLKDVYQMISSTGAFKDEQSFINFAQPLKKKGQTISAPSQTLQKDGGEVGNVSQSQSVSPSQSESDFQVGVRPEFQKNTIPNVVETTMQQVQPQVEQVVEQPIEQKQPIDAQGLQYQWSDTQQPIQQLETPFDNEATKQNKATYELEKIKRTSQEVAEAKDMGGFEKWFNNYANKTILGTLNQSSDIPNKENLTLGIMSMPNEEYVKIFGDKDRQQAIDEEFNKGIENYTKIYGNGTNKGIYESESDFVNLTSDIAGLALDPMFLVLETVSGGTLGIAAEATAKVALKTALKTATKEMIAKGLSKKVAEEYAIKGLNNWMLKQAPQISKAIATGGQTLGMYDAIQNVNQQAQKSLSEGKDFNIDDINVSETLKSFGKGFTVGAVMPIAGTFGGRYKQLIDKSLQSNTIKGLQKAGINTAELGTEIATFGVLSPALSGETPTFDTFKDAAKFIIGLRLARGIKQPIETAKKFKGIIVSDKFNKENANIGNYRVEYTNEEAKDLGLENPNEVTARFLDNPTATKEMIDNPNIPLTTKMKVLWSTEGVASDILPEPKNVTVEENTLKIFDKNNNLIDKKTFDNSEDAQLQANLMLDRIADFKKLEIFDNLPIEKQHQVRNNLMRQGFDFNAHTDALSTEPTKRSKEQWDLITKVDETILKTKEEYEKELKETPTEQPKIEQNGEEVQGKNQEIIPQEIKLNDKVEINTDEATPKVITYDNNGEISNISEFKTIEDANFYAKEVSDRLDKETTKEEIPIGEEPLEPIIEVPEEIVNPYYNEKGEQIITDEKAREFALDYVNNYISDRQKKEVGFREDFREVSGGAEGVNRAIRNIKNGKLDSKSGNEQAILKALEKSYKEGGLNMLAGTGGMTSTEGVEIKTVIDDMLKSKQEKAPQETKTTKKPIDKKQEAINKIERGFEGLSAKFGGKKSLLPEEKTTLINDIKDVISGITELTYIELKNYINGYLTKNKDNFGLSDTDIKEIEESVLVDVPQKESSLKKAEIKNQLSESFGELKGEQVYDEINNRIGLDTNTKRIYEKSREKLKSDTFEADTNDLIKEIIRTKQGTAEDLSDLMVYNVRLRNQKIDLLERLAKAETQSEKDIIQSQIDAVEVKQEALFEASRNLGTQSSTIFRVLQGFAKDDYSYAGVKRKMEGNGKLSKEQNERIKQSTEKLEKTQKQLDDELQKQEDELLQQSLIEDVKNDARLKRIAKTENDIAKSKERIRKAIEEAKQSSRQINDITQVMLDATKLVTTLAKEYTYQGVKKIDLTIKNILEDIKDVYPELTEVEIRKILTKEKTSDVISEQRKLRNEKNRLEKNQQLTTEQKKEARRIKDLEKRKSDIEKGIIKRKEKVVDSEEVKRLKEEIQKIKDESGITEKEKEAQQIKNLENRIKTNKEKINSGKLFDDVKAKRKESETVKKLKIEAEAIKEELDIEIEKHRLKERPKWLRTTDQVLDAVFDLPIGMMAGTEMSFIMKQGLMNLVNPLKYKVTAQAFKDLGKQMFSQKNADDYERYIRTTDVYRQYKQMGGRLMETNPKLRAKDEVYKTNLGEKIPIIGQLYKFSSRAYQAYINSMRLNDFQRILDKMEKIGQTPENNPELFKAFAETVNNNTGTASLGKGEALSSHWNKIFFATRLFTARIKSLLRPFDPSMPKEAKKDLLQNLGATIGTMGVVYASLFALRSAMTDDEKEKFDIELDPRSSSWLKIRNGNLVTDPLGGYIQLVRTLAQVISGEKKTSSGEIEKLGLKYGTDTRFDTAVNYFTNKLAPIPGLAIKKLKETDQRPVSLPKEIASFYLPMFLFSEIEILSEENPALFEALITGLNYIGTTTNKQETLDYQQAQRIVKKRIEPKKELSREEKLAKKQENAKKEKEKEDKVKKIIKEYPEWRKNIDELMGEENIEYVEPKKTKSKKSKSSFGSKFGKRKTFVSKFRK